MSDLGWSQEVRALASAGTRIATACEQIKAARRIARDLRRAGASIPDTIVADLERALQRSEIGLQLEERGVELGLEP